MQRVARKWVIPQAQTVLENELVRSLGVSRVMAQVLINRGLIDGQAVRRFLMDEERPGLLPLSGLEAAVNRIRRAEKRKERVLVYGDYDVDGVASTVLMQSALMEVGIEADHYIPDRLEEGYGLNREALGTAADKGYTLIVTVDCGISSKSEVELARTLGIDVVITDHHDPPAELPCAEAVVNPKLDPTGNELAGVGVAYHLACALLQASGLPDYERKTREYLDLVALGTVADVVPLLGVNRWLVREGLKVLAATERVGLRELLRSTNLLDKELDPWHIGFVLGPRLNAAGRVGSAETAVRLLRTTGTTEAAELVEALESANQERQSWERRILAEVEAMVESDPGRSSASALLFMGESWHPGVIGIVASRLVEKYHRPVILFAREGERCTGSGRSVPGLDLIQALRECGSWLEEYGGHSQAAGMTIAADRFEGFSEEFVQTVKMRWGLAASAPELAIDAVAGVDELNCGLRLELERLKPFGAGNPAPLLLLEGTEIDQCQVLGTNKEHLKMRLSGSGEFLDAIAFRQAAAAEAGSIRPGSRVDLAFYLEENTWRGRSRLQLRVKELRPALPALPCWEEVEAAVGRGECCLLVQGLPLWAEEFWEKCSACFDAAGLKGAMVLSHQTPDMHRRFWEVLHGEGLDLVLTTADYLTYYVEKFSASRRRVGLLLIDRDSADAGHPDLTGAVAALGQPEVRECSYLRRILSPRAGETAWRARQWSYPHREHLAEVFRYLRQKGGSGDWVAVDSRELSSWWKRNRPGETPDLKQLLPASIYIMEEIGMLSVRAGQSGPEVTINHARGQRFELTRSLRFREGSRLRLYHQGIEQRG